MEYHRKLFSVIVPARNEEAQIGITLRAIIKAIAAHEQQDCDSLDLASTCAEVIVVDNNSDDNTANEINHFVEKHSVVMLSSNRLTAPCARNDGAAASQGRILTFIDADTHIPENAFSRITELVNAADYGAGIFKLLPQKLNVKSWLWWAFWNHVRQWPFSRAKALPAFMFCTREIFDHYGPFDENVVIGEEWPILAGLYRGEPHKLIYDRTIAAYTSNRRMDLTPLGYTRVFTKYVWAILHHSGRVHYPDHIRQEAEDIV